MIAMMSKRTLRLLLAALCLFHSATAFVIPASTTTTTTTTKPFSTTRRRTAGLFVPPLRVAVDTSEIKK
jgi:hypothetical protein